jgi:hypothetical protein
VLGPQAQQKLVTRTVRAQTVPLLASINKEFAARAASGRAAVGGYTNALVRDLTPQAEQTHGIYNAALTQQAADDAALANRLAGLGGQVSENLRSQLTGAIGETQLAQITQGAAGQGASAGATVAGLGTAARGALRGAGTAAETYASELPAIARTGGLQRISQLLGQLGTQRSSALSAVREKIPGITADVAQQVRAEQFQKAVARQSGLAQAQQAAATTAYRKAQLGQGQQRIDLATAKAQSDAIFKKAGLDIRRDNYKLAVQREHRLGLAKKGKKGGFTPLQLSHLRGTAIETAKDWKHGVPATHYASGEVKQAGQPGHPEPSAARGLVRFLVNHGIPPTMAVWATNQVYGKGHWYTSKKQERKAAAGAAQTVTGLLGLRP